MPVTAADALILRCLAQYYVLTREQLQRLCFPGHAPSGRSTRKRLGKLQRAGLIARHRIPVALPGTNGAAPVYYLTAKGAELLASWFDDERYLAVSTRHPRGDRLSHWIALNETRMVIEAAVARQDEVQLLSWVSEWQTIHEGDGQAEGERFYLHTQLSAEPPLSCSPDAGFLLSARGHSKVYYLERDLCTSSPKQIAARKTKGYAELLRRSAHRTHFPQSTLSTFSVLLVTRGKTRCRQIGKELAKHPLPELWLLLDEMDLTPEAFLFEPITFNVRGEAAALIRRVPPATEGATQ